MITQRLASIQNGIAQFMHGEQYGSALNVRTIDAMLRRKVVNVEDYAQEKFKRFQEEAVTTMIGDGGLPLRCTSCSMYECKFSHTKDDLADTDCFRMTVRCQSRGCDDARREYVENFKRIAADGSAAINLSVEIVPDEINVEAPTLDGAPRYITKAEFENRIKITPAPLSATDESGSVTLDASSLSLYDKYGRLRVRMGAFNELEGPAFTKNDRFKSKEKSIQEQEQEIAELLQMSGAQDMSRYGEVAW